MINYLETELVDSLREARSIYVAVALIKDYGFNIIHTNIPATCKSTYILGIHLPTPPNIFRKLLELQNINPEITTVKVFNSQENYHPKVYLIEKISGDLVAFIGSANATRGGFTHNIEMNVKITDQADYIKLRSWFDTLFIAAKYFDLDFINKYEITYKRNRTLSSTQKSNTQQVIDNTNPIARNKLIVSSSQYFRQSDFDAFDTVLHYDTSGYAVRLRANVKERLIELGEKIKNYFFEYKIKNLHLPYRRNLYTSQHFHSRGHDHIAKDAIWLNFGKSWQELQTYQDGYRSFVNHLRIQVILRNSSNDAYIGIWLYIAKHQRSYFDRQRLKNGLNDSNYLARLYEYIIELGGSYWIMLGDEEINISDIENTQQLYDFLIQDDYNPEFIIGRNYSPNDPDLTDENITETVLLEFSKLYKIYDLIKA
jgi:HKD family nuclease